MDFKLYQTRATETAVYPGQGTFQGLIYAMLGLAGETGETGEQIKKTWRDDGTSSFEDAMLEILRGLESCDTAHGLREEHWRSAYDQIHEIFNIELTPERREKLIKEMGDVLWYLAQLATELGADLGLIAQLNLDKLAARKKNDLIHGEGSDR